MKKLEELNELRSLDMKALKERTEELERELMNLRFRGRSSGQLEKPSELKQVRRKIARVNTIVQEKLSN